MEMNEKSDLAVLADEMRWDEEGMYSSKYMNEWPVLIIVRLLNEVRLLQVSAANLKQKLDQMGSLQVTVTNLEAEVSRLRKDLAALEQREKKYRQYLFLGPVKVSSVRVRFQQSQLRKASEGYKQWGYNFSKVDWGRRKDRVEMIEVDDRYISEYELDTS